MLAELGDPSSSLPGGQLVKLTDHTITDSGRLEEQLAEIRLTGQASEINELEEGSASLALPVQAAGRVSGRGTLPHRPRRTVHHNLRTRGGSP